MSKIYAIIIDGSDPFCGSYFIKKVFTTREYAEEALNSEEFCPKEWYEIKEFDVEK